MHSKQIKFILTGLLIILLCSFNKQHYPPVDHNELAKKYFKEDAGWYLDNIPFFECSDKQIEEVYYYRWKLYKAHIRNTGDNNHIITEFIDHVAWDRDPYCTINAASMHHIAEGRWLKDSRYVNDYIDYLYQHGGNNRRYSESIADATWGNYLVTADKDFISKQLDSMISIYNQWSDHWEETKQLYWIPAMPDATEYTIASIDASGGTAGFDGGETFRPSINSYMFANAMAISKLAAMKGDAATSNQFLQKANTLKTTVQQNLWNESMQHFCDRFKQDNRFVHYWDFIRGRELNGLIPWYFNLPDDNDKYNAAWKHATGTNELLGPFGFRTNEPSYEYYFRQFVFCFGKPGSQWNGPSWPYQSSLAITGMANLLNDYHQNIISNSHYLHVLRQYAKQHYLPDGNINLVENYDPNTGGPIVYYYWSNHYLHSSYNNMIITGLCGLRPAEGNTLTLNPLIDQSISYFTLDDVMYHGHRLSIVYDREGTKYNVGKGLSVFVDGEKKEVKSSGKKYEVVIGDAIITEIKKQPANQALNIQYKGYPVPSASVNNSPDSLYKAIDGRIWYFPEIINRWSTNGSKGSNDWFQVDFEKPTSLSTAKIYLFADSISFSVPDEYIIEYKKGDDWLPVKVIQINPAVMSGNTGNTVKFDKITTNTVRVNFIHKHKQVALTELELY